MKKFLMLLLIAGLPAVVFCQANKQQAAKVKKVTVTDHVYEKGVDKSFKDSETWYDAKGNVMEVIEYKDGKVTKHETYEYDAAGNKIKESVFDEATGKLAKTVEYKYNNSNLKTEKAVYDASHKLKSKKVYQYDLF
jgi:hypothetical protein